jgi:hypothetical protein
LDQGRRQRRIHERSALVRALLDHLIALPFNLLPRRMWDDWDLPIANVTLASSLLTFFGGCAFGISGYFSYMEYVLAQREWTAPPLMLAVYISYVIGTPRGLFSLYLAFSGAIRFIAGYISEPHGDPILTAFDALIRRAVHSKQQHGVRVARQRLEGADEPDRRHDGQWAGLSAVDYVIVSARRKPGWTRGTWVITDDGWFVLGEPFDRPTANGLRTIYPLTRQTTLEPIRKSVQYELPPLRETRAAPRASKQQ